MGSVTATYRIPKAKIPVRMLLRNRTLHRLELFVPLQEARKPPGRVIRELLEQPRAFFPGRDLDTDAFLLVQRDAVLWAAVERAQSQALEELELYDRHVWVRVDLEDGSRLEGELFYSAPTARSRVMDHLNGPERFFFLHRPDRLVLVNKAYVVYVVEAPGTVHAPLRLSGSAAEQGQRARSRGDREQHGAEAGGSEPVGHHAGSVARNEDENEDEDEDENVGEEPEDHHDTR
jgi:hypothetical protein